MFRIVTVFCFCFATSLLCCFTFNSVLFEKRITEAGATYCAVKEFVASTVLRCARECYRAHDCTALSFSPKTMNCTLFGYLSNTLQMGYNPTNGINWIKREHLNLLSTEIQELTGDVEKNYTTTPVLQHTGTQADTTGLTAEMAKAEISTSAETETTARIENIEQSTTEPENSETTSQGLYAVQHLCQSHLTKCYIFTTFIRKTVTL